VDCLEAAIVRERSSRHRAAGNIRVLFKNLVFATILGYFEKAGKRLTVPHTRPYRILMTIPPEFLAG
jgi:hypothetical protein